MGARAAAGGDDVVEGEALVEGLGDDLVGAGNVAQSPHGVRTTARDDVSLASRRRQVAGDRFHRRHQVGAGRNDGDAFRAQEAEQEVVAARLGIVGSGDALLQHQPAPEALARRGGQGEAAVVGLRRAARHQRVRALRERVGDQEFQLSRLVAAGRQAERVVALDPQGRAPAARS